MATVKGEVIMDYEKKYKEMKARVLEIGRGYVKGLDYSKPRQIAEYIDPELKEESADERIINRIKKAVENYWSDEPLNEILAWLEKQGKQKPVISYNALREGIGNFGITQYQIDYWLKKYVDIEKQGEQILANSAKTCKDEQKPAWSEKDKKILNYLLWFYDTCFRWNDTCNDDIKFGDIVTFLKSLRPQSTWKPSDEQMDNLSRACNGGIYRTSLLMELYQDLKKLKK